MQALSILLFGSHIREVAPIHRTFISGITEWLYIDVKQDFSKKEKYLVRSLEATIIDVHKPSVCTDRGAINYLCDPVPGLPSFASARARFTIKARIVNTKSLFKPL